MMTMLVVASTAAHAAPEDKGKGNSCAAWLEWLNSIAFFEELRATAVAEIEARDGYYAAVDADIEWRQRIKALMNNPPGGKEKGK